MFFFLIYLCPFYQNLGQDKYKLYGMVPWKHKLDREEERVQWRSFRFKIDELQIPYQSISWLKSVYKIGGRHVGDLKGI